MNATQAQKFYEECLSTIYVRSQLERLSDYYRLDVTLHPPIPGMPAGLAGMELATRGFLSAFSDFAPPRIDDFTQEGDTFRCKVRVTGTHSGELMGVAATGRRVEIATECRFRIQGDKISESWSDMDITRIQRELSSPAQVA